MLRNFWELSRAPMPDPGLFRNRTDQLIDMRYPLAVLATRLDWNAIETQFAPMFAHQPRSGRATTDTDWFGEPVLVGGGASAAGRPRLPIRLMASLLYLKHAYGESDEVVEIRILAAARDRIVASLEASDTGTCA